MMLEKGRLLNAAKIWKSRAAERGWERDLAIALDALSLFARCCR
jgi:hypothetical protein